MEPSLPLPLKGTTAMAPIRAMIHQWDGSAWNQLGDDLDGEAAGDRFGRSVSLSNDGTIVAVGGAANDGNGSNSGHTRVYQWDGSTWNQLGNDIDGEAAADAFGTNVSISGDGTVVAIGADGNDAAGSMPYTRIYQWDGSQESTRQRH